MSRLSIPARLVLLSSVLILILVGVSTFLSRELNHSSQALAAEAHYSEILRSASAAEKAFGDLKYWLTDLAVSLLTLSEDNANDAKRSLQAQLAVLELYDKPAVDTIRREVDLLATRALEAVDAYTEDRRVIGNSLMARARVHVEVVDETLSGLVSKLRSEASRASEAAQRESQQAVRTSGLVVLIASLFAVALTVFVLRSIMLPLRQIRGTIGALTAGRTDISIPDMGRHEMGAIARTLSLFRDGQIERDRLAAEREEALQRVEAARDEATKSSRILQATFDHMAQGVSMFDADHRLVAWNSQFRDLLDLPESLLRRGTSYVDVIRYLIQRGDFGEGDVEEQIRKRVSTLREPYLGERTRPDGTIFEIRRNPVATGGFVTMYTDITERKRAQLEIERASRRLTDAIESISDGFALWDRDNRLFAYNDRCKPLLKLPDLLVEGLEFETFLRALARNVAGASASNEDMDAWVAGQLDLHRHPPVEQELELGGGAWLRAAARRTDEGGNVTTWTDITALKNRELELADLVDRLEVARDQANEASRTKSAFLANMSHELRTPLNAIIGYSEILKEEAADQELPDFLPDLDRIEGAGRHLLGVINDVLDLSKIEAGRMDVYVEDFDVAKLVREVEAIIQPLAAKNSNRLEIHCPADIGAMRSDITKVKQSLLNLLSNSSKFTSEGELRLEVSRRREDGGGGSVSFRVSDTGIGMTREQMAKLFQAFTQADTTTTKRFGGTGLGLAITRHFCDMLGGRVEVESELGKGSVFTMTIPDRTVARPAENGHEPTASRGAEAPVGAPTVLVVDDDAAVHDLLSITLGKEGYRVVHARSGEDAIRLARSERPDAITLDVVMPHMDGWSVLSLLKAQSDLSDIPVIVVTMLKDRGMALTLGASDFMTKPVDRASLLAALKRHCPSPGGTVLLVDDDLAVRDSARRVLEKLGYVVGEAAHGQAALMWLRENPAPALILLDLMMPVMDGFAFLDAMRDHPSAGQVPIVILTSMQLSAEEKAVLSGRAEEVLSKDTTSPLDLAEVVRRTAGRARASDPSGAQMHFHGS